MIILNKMEKLTKEQIEEINSKVPENQGVFLQPYGIPVSIKTPVIYTRWESGGYMGGSCWNDRPAYPYSNDRPSNYFQVLNKVLEYLKPDVSYSQYKEIESLIDDNTYYESEYYGNSTDWEINFIVLDDLYKLLETFK